MKSVVVPDKVEINLGYYRYITTIYPHTPYLFYEEDLESMYESGIVFSAEDISFLDKSLNAGSDLNGKSVLYFCSGDYNTSLFDLQFIRHLEKKYPSASIDVVTHIDLFFLMQQFGFKGGWVKYPMPVEFMEKYDYVFTNEYLYSSVRKPGIKILEKYLASFGIDNDLSELKFHPFSSITHAIEDVSSAQKTVAVHINSEYHPGKYPAEKFLSLIELLLQDKLNIVLTGYASSVDDFKSLPVVNLIGKHTTPIETLITLSRVDCIISTESFAARAGGIFKIPTVLILSNTDYELYKIYSTVKPVFSKSPCAPCYRLDKCPLGYDCCIAYDDDSVSPENIRECVKKIL